MTDKEISLLLPDYDPTVQCLDSKFDSEKAMHAVNFFPLLLRHHKGQWNNERFVLSDWQISIVANMFGWIRPDGTRRYRSSLIELPRKAGKSSLSAGLALMCLTSDEQGGEVYTAAADRDQANIVFNIAKRFVESDEYLSKHCKIYRHAIVVPSTGSTMKALASDSRTAHGLNASAVICDELHVWTKPDARELYEALITSQGARKQPLNISITTAGTAEPTLWLDLHNYARKVQDGTVVDSSFLPAIWAAKKDDKWDDPEVWAKCNPSLGTTVDVEFYEQECTKAKALPSYQNAFRRLYLNQPTEQLNRFIDMQAWDSCEEPYTAEELKGRECYAGLDLSSTLDLTALVLVFPRTEEEGDGFDLLPYFFVPNENIARRQHDDGVPYIQWRDDGHLIATEGDVVDYSFIKKKVLELHIHYNIREVIVDRWCATQLAVQLEQEGLNVGFFGQGYRSMSAPCKHLEAMVMGKRLRHGGHPVLRFCASVCSAQEDSAGNIKLCKRKSTERIDGLVATVMGIGRANAATDSAESVYESQDMEIL
jgi:phage terminase large subunit-like protein